MLSAVPLAGRLALAPRAAASDCRWLSMLPSVSCCGEAARLTLVSPHNVNLVTQKLIL